MKTKLLSAVVMLASAFTVFPAHADTNYDDFNSGPVEKWRGCYKGARTPAVVMNYQNLLITPINKKTLTVDLVKQAIVRAAQKSKWTIGEVAQGKAGGRLEATLLVRNKHTVVVEIPYTSDKYSLLYKNSVNMNYALCEGEGYIHPNYNVWVGNLKNAIQAELDAIK